jgi:hypothetical protein
MTTEHLIESLQADQDRFLAEIDPAVQVTKLLLRHTDSWLGPIATDPMPPSQGVPLLQLWGQALRLGLHRSCDTLHTWCKSREPQEAEAVCEAATLKLRFLVESQRGQEESHQLLDSCLAKDLWSGFLRFWVGTHAPGNLYPGADLYFESQEPLDRFRTGSGSGNHLDFVALQRFEPWIGHHINVLRIEELDECIMEIRMAQVD